jgi:hypothetical protein
MIKKISKFFKGLIKKDKNVIFQGSDWKDYSDFEFKWLEIVLTKNIIKKEDILSLLKKFKIKFLEKNWEDCVRAEEMGNVLINDVPKKELWLEVTDILSKKYADKLNFDEAYKIWGELSNYSRDDLSKIYKEISTNKDSSDFVNDKNFSENEESAKEFLISFIIEEFCKISKEEAIDIIKEASF